MIAALYARKSTDQNVATEAKSVTRQVEHARAFAATKGWRVTDAHVYIDDGISGTEFKKRPAFMRMMGALTPKAPFQVLIVSEQKSIGREMSETAMTIKRLAQAGVEIFEYVHGTSLTPTTPTAKLLSSVQGFSDEDHAVKTSERVIEAHTKLFGMGRVVGGRVFGYDNRHIFKGVDASGNPLKSHTERELNPVEAAVVRRIFDLYDAGEGLKRIAMQLNGEGAACPKPFVRKDPTKVLPVAGWAPGTVRTILMRELYHGVVIWNKTRKRDDFRQVNQRPRPESEWLRADGPYLFKIAICLVTSLVHALIAPRAENRPERTTESAMLPSRSRTITAAAALPRPQRTEGSLTDFRHPACASTHSPSTNRGTAPARISGRRRGRGRRGDSPSPITPSRPYRSASRIAGCTRIHERYCPRAYLRRTQETGLSHR
jgi:site-specific DNA recombinase